jgi:hypothetical protein
MAGKVRLTHPCASFAAVALTAAGLAGCSLREEPSTITRTGSIAPVEQPSGSLRRAPSPLTARDVEAQPKGSAQQTFMLLWFYGQWGNASEIYSLYDPGVQQALGADLIVGAYTEDRPTMLASLPRIVDVHSTRSGTMVNVELLTATARPRPESFLLARRGGSWRVRYDTYLEGTVQSYAQSREQTHIAPTASTPGPEAVAAGARAARRYRTLFVGR